MLTLLVPLISIALGTLPPARATDATNGAALDVPLRGPAAQVRLAELIGEADAIHAIVPRRARAIDIVLDHAGVAYRVTASVGARGEVTSLATVEQGPASGERGNLSWLSPEVVNATAIVRLVVDADHAVTLTTDAGEAFMVIPGRGSGGSANAAASARWAAAWDSPDA